MSIYTILFYLMGFITLASAIFVASTGNLVRSVFMFFITLFGLSGLYVFALADFVAITQVVIYVGGILVLILFAFMLSGRQALEKLKERKHKFISLQKLPALVLAALFLVVLVNIIAGAGVDNLPWIKRADTINNVISPTTDTTGNLGVGLMTHYLLPFEAISILLLMALVGASQLARKEGDE